MHEIPGIDSGETLSVETVDTDNGPLYRLTVYTGGLFPSDQTAVRVACMDLNLDGATDLIDALITAIAAPIREQILLKRARERDAMARVPVWRGTPQLVRSGPTDTTE